MQRLDRGTQPWQVPVVAHDVIGIAQPLGAADLARHDGPDRLRGELTAAHHARNLFFFIAVDHQDPAGEIVVSASFDQERHHYHGIRRGSRRSTHSRFHLGAYHGMQQRFEFLFRGRVRKNQFAHALAVERAVRRQIFRAELCTDCTRTGLTRGGQLMGNLIGVDHRGAQFRQDIADTAFAAAGVPLVEALDSVAGAAGNHEYYLATKKIQAEVSTGSSLTVSMQNVEMFPNMVLQMVAIGEEAGSLDGMLSKVADFFEAEVDDAVDALSSLMEPLIMVVLGTLIGGMVIAMYLPIFKLGQAV